ncbi:MAG: hypothetical protein ACI9S8_001668 [Chlamydiales bacterium]
MLRGELVCDAAGDALRSDRDMRGPFYYWNGHMGLECIKKSKLNVTPNCDLNGVNLREN